MTEDAICVCRVCRKKKPTARHLAECDARLDTRRRRYTAWYLKALHKARLDNPEGYWELVQRRAR